jgi:hypothetical protein
VADFQDVKKAVEDLLKRASLMAAPIEQNEHGR